MQAAEEPKPKPKPKRRRIATAAAGGGVIEEGSEASSRPAAALADNGSPRPAVKRRRTSHMGRPNKQSQHVHDGALHPFNRDSVIIPPVILLEFMLACSDFLLCLVKPCGE